MPKSSTPKPTMAQSKSLAIILPDGTITEHHPGTSFTTLNGNKGSIDEGHTGDGPSSIKGEYEDVAAGNEMNKDSVKNTNKRKAPLNEKPPSSKKQRIPPEEATTAIGEADAPSTPPPAPKRGRGRPPQTPDTTASRDNLVSSADSTQVPSSVSTAVTSVATSPTTEAHRANSKKRSITGSVNKARGIPTSLAEASEADRAMMRMKEDNKTWIEINAMWEAMTGEKPGKSTLPNRYQRLRSNLMSLEDGDSERLLRVKAAVERRFENEKWATIKDEMVAEGSKGEYTTAFLQKEFKKLAAAAEEVSAGGSQTATTDDKANTNESNPIANLPAGEGGVAVKSEDKGDDEEA